MEDSKQTLFDKLYSASKELVNELKKPLIKSQLERKFSSAYDSAEEQRIDAELKLQELRSNFKHFEINSILELKATMKSAEETKEALAAEYKEYFGKELK